MAPTKQPRTIPFVEAYWKGDRQKPSAIILRSAFTTPEKGAALGMANFWNTPLSPQDISHYIIDEQQVIQTVLDDVLAGSWQQQTRGSIRLTLCAEPMAMLEFWDDASHTQVLHRTAELVASLCVKYNIKVRYLDDAQASRWAHRPSRRKGGIIVDVRGEWPHTAFLDDVFHQFLKMGRSHA